MQEIAGSDSDPHVARLHALPPRQQGEYLDGSRVLNWRLGTFRFVNRATGPDPFVGRMGCYRQLSVNPSRQGRIYCSERRVRDHRPGQGPRWGLHGKYR
jgi:hypothetical protein